MNNLSVTGTIRRFPGTNGWHYVPLNDQQSADLRPLAQGVWPALIGAQFTVNDTTWKSSIMPIKDGPLFIALPVKVRRAEKLKDGQQITVECSITDRITA